MAGRIGLVTGQEIRENRDGGVDVRLLQVQFTNELDVQTVQYMPLPGDDSPPMVGDKVVVIALGPAFKVAIGVQDSVVPAMAAGTKKLYSRDGNGDVAAFINFLASGLLELNGNADFATKFDALDAAMQSLVTSINNALATKLDGGGSAGTLTLDISAAKATTVKL